MKKIRQNFQTFSFHRTYFNTLSNIKQMKVLLKSHNKKNLLSPGNIIFKTRQSPKQLCFTVCIKGEVRLIKCTDIKISPEYG